MKDLIQEAAQAWGGFQSAPKLVAQRENAVFDVSLSDGRRCALRVHRIGYQSAAAVEAELHWTESLTANGFRCPRPVQTPQGTFLHQTQSGQVLSMVSWIDASTLFDIQNKNVLIQNFYNLGNMLADLHQISDTSAKLDPTVRPAWDCKGLTGPDPLWGRYWENPALQLAEATVLREKRDLARTWLKQLDYPDIGAIHADALGENVLVDDAGLWLIDFDDAGIGYRLYDLGVALVQYWNDPDLSNLINALCAGYADCKGIGIARLLDQVPRFMALRALASAGWIMSRASADDPRQAYYLGRALHCAKYLNDDV
ncbi:phosphotransferase enzyme family protein [Parasulfitobacter algicola]|uniref:Phosphotransferase n=1 Tax=Parasulfitobacter algicola TaxID=2614809 RepID=A0ABX2IS57_9RHOB|nr:phosphotransferase [Sulfitobacter algicola]NSX54851.1 phosphotransferase [Sulfitobacter algicola]